MGVWKGGRELIEVQFIHSKLDLQAGSWSLDRFKGVESKLDD